MLRTTDKNLSNKNSLLSVRLISPLSSTDNACHRGAQAHQPQEGYGQARAFTEKGPVRTQSNWSHKGSQRITHRVQVHQSGTHRRRGAGKLRSPGTGLRGPPRCDREVQARCKRPRRSFHKCWDQPKCQDMKLPKEIPKYPKLAL